MKAKIIDIGNSKGVRLPKAVIEQCGLKDNVELTVSGNRITIMPVHNPRAGWDKAFKAMKKHGDDAQLLPEFSNQWDQTEWKW
jgi:antitoxin MazE